VAGCFLLQKKKRIAFLFIPSCSTPVFSLFSARCGQGLYRKFPHPYDRKPSKFIVLADSMKSTINKAWEHGGADFQSRFDKSTAQAEQMKERGAAGFCD
jgi:hypothetical protein